MAPFSDLIQNFGLMFMTVTSPDVSIDSNGVSEVAHNAAEAAHSLPHLIQDLGLILMAAAVMTLLFKWMKQPIVLGYLIAGFIVSEYFPGPFLSQYLPDFVPRVLQVSDKASIHLWSEIGVIFMLFGLGLEFSFKKLLAVGKTASITGGFEVCSTTVIGFIVGKILGWNNMDSIFFGAMLAMSSTTIIVKVFDELNLKGRAFAPIVFGALIVEDLLAILLLVLLSSIAISQQVAGGELLFSSLKLVFFLILWFIMGIFLLPWFLKRCRDLLTDEILLIVSTGLCFMMVIIACKTGFSAALGAFVMGSILAETTKGTRIEHVIQPVKDLFSAVFFVSVGMMIDPAILYKYAGTIAIITVVTIVAKFIGTGIGALLSGCSVRNSMQAGMSMAQIGEFSFIIATLGKTLGVISDFLYPVAVAVSAVTTLTTPYLIKCSGPIAEWLNARIPERIQLSLLRYEVAMTESTGRENVLALLWRVHGLKIMLNSVMVISIALGVQFVADRALGDHFEEQPTLASIGACAVAIFLATPFLWAVFRNKPIRSDDFDTDTIVRLKELHLGVSILRFIIGCFLVGFLVHSFTTTLAMIAILVSIVAVIFLIFSRFFEPVYQRIEERFVSNLTEKERAEVENRSKHSHLAPWEVSLTEFVLSQNSPLVGKMLRDSGLRSDVGVTVTMIQRGSTRLMPPKSNDLLFPFDKIYLIGSDEQLEAARKLIETQSIQEAESPDENYGLTSIFISSDHPYAGKTIRESGIREKADGLIVGLERNGKRHLNPDPSMPLLSGDIVWVVGNIGLIHQI